MYAIETSLGRFEADTEKEAKKALRAARRKQDKIDAENSAKHTAAMFKAYREAYRIQDCKLSGKELPPGWRLQVASASAWCCREIYSTDRAQRGYSIETNDGRAEVFPYDPITHYVENGAGFCMAVCIANQDAEVFAVGIEDGRATWIPLAGIKKDDFRKGSRS